MSTSIILDYKHSRINLNNKIFFSSFRWQSKYKFALTNPNYFLQFLNPANNRRFNSKN